MFEHDEPEGLLKAEHMEGLGFWLLHLELRVWNKYTLKKIRSALALIEQQLGTLKADCMDEKHSKFLRLIGFVPTDEWHISVDTGDAKPLWRFSNGN